MNTRVQNEKKFSEWFDLPDGGRRYWHEITGRHGWKARYNKIVDANENTIRFYQEIFIESGRLRQIHQKFPHDTGHEPVEDESE
ncbi:MAG: hypothetical protein GC154_13445 [bacterium]|nr:hypothetical protein [bacterium]